MARYRITANMEFVRSADLDFRKGIVVARKLGYHYIEPMVHTGHELLSEVGVRQPLSEARELTESTHTLRAGVLTNLLKHCTSVKTVRLCLTLGEELSLPWASKLDPKQLPTGSNKPWVSRSREGTLVLKP